MSLVFWDTNLFVYWMEDHPQFSEKVRWIRTRMLERKDRICTSALSVGEVLAGPYVRQDERLAQRYRSVLAPPHLQILAFTTETADHYARIRVDRTISPADAIQLACAAEARVDLFLTNDRRLSRKIIPGIQFIAGLEIDFL